MIGRDGQISSNVVADVVLEQTTRRSRRRGDAKTICRHLRHTCVSVFHLHERESLDGLFDKGSSLYKSNISRRTSSGSMSITTGPTLDQSRVVGDAAQTTNFEVVLHKSFLPGDIPHAQPEDSSSLSLQRGHHPLAHSKTQWCWETRPGWSIQKWGK